MSLIALAAGATSGFAETTPAAPAPLNYDDAQNWVCAPALGKTCSDNLRATALLADGSSRVEAFHPAKTPKADCFYVYPTVSLSPGLSAMAGVTAAERRAVRQQVGRLASVCRIYAPFYRQITVSSLSRGFKKPSAEAARAAGAMALADVIAAWDRYMSRFNQGRPFVLIGHSQGSFMLIGLAKTRIDNQPTQKHLLSLIIPGAFVQTPRGKEVGGTFKAIPPCGEPGQIGCVIAFNSVRADRVLPPDMKAPQGDVELVCTNPAVLDGGGGVLKPYFSTRGETIIPALTAPQPPWTNPEHRIGSPFVTTPDLYSASCRHDEHGAVLAISTERKPGDWRTGAITGDWTVEQKSDATMGLHLIDLNLTAGNLVEVIGRQIETMSSPRASVWGHLGEQ